MLLNRWWFTLLHNGILLLLLLLLLLRWAWHVARMEEGRSAFKILTGKPTGKRPLGRLRRRWKDNIKIELKNWY